MTDVEAPLLSETWLEPSAPDRTSQPWWRRPSVSALVLLGLMAFAVFASLGAMERSLPLQDPDEEFFAVPAVSIAASGDPNPHWFGHPGSTVIYPMAALIHVWDAALHDGPIFGSNPELQERFDKNPRPFYLIGRFWSLALAVAAIPVVFALGRRAFNQQVGLIGAVLWTVLPEAIHHGRTVRTESPAMFFGLVALYFCVRAWQEPRRRWWLLAGVAVGLAVASRYFMVTLVPCLVAASVLPLRRDRHRAFFAAITALVASAVAFVLATPYALLDLGTLMKDLGAQNEPHKVASGLSRTGQAWWYVREAIPSALTWPLYVAALLGILLILRQRRPYQLLLVAYCGIFLVAISSSNQYWQRWTFAMLPILVLFAAVAVQKLSTFVAARAPRALHPRVLVPVALTGVLAIMPLSDIRATNDYDEAQTTSAQAREWMQDNVPAGSRVSQLQDTINIPPWGIPLIGHGIKIDYALDATKPFSEYRSDGVDYIATGPGEPFRYLSASDRYPKQAAFYLEVACKSRLVAQFRRSASQVGWGINIYRLDQAPVQVLDYFCTQPPPTQP
jgi:4-amino-4-deoxy-L-arabinose transferase-like glycosyltransferase